MLWTYRVSVFDRGRIYSFGLVVSGISSLNIIFLDLLLGQINVTWLSVVEQRRGLTSFFINTEDNADFLLSDTDMFVYGANTLS